jgi:hypothetical protein
MCRWFTDDRQYIQKLKETITQTLVQPLSPVSQLPSTYQQRNLQIEAVPRLQALEVLLSKDPEAECDRNMGPSFTYMADMSIMLL